MASSYVVRLRSAAFVLAGKPLPFPLLAPLDVTMAELVRQVFTCGRLPTT